jgi:hypothetical protein
MVPLVAMASIETSAPRNPSSSARRASKAGIAVSSLALSGTASWLSTNRLVVAKAATRWFGASPVARSWLRRAGFAVDGDHVRTARPGLAHPGRKGCLKQRRVDPVHKDGQPTPSRHTMGERRGAAQQVQVRLAPGGDMVVVIAVVSQTTSSRNSHSGWRSDEHCVGPRSGQNDPAGQPSVTCPILA